MKYCYTFKNTIYFRKLLNKKYLISRESSLIYRRSLRLCLDEDFYLFLENNKNELIKILNFINLKLTLHLHIDNKLSVQDINIFIKEICQDYKKEIPIGNSINKQKSLYLQSLTFKYKNLDNQYKNFSNKEKTKKVAIEIITDSNLSLENIIKEVPSNKLIQFFEMVIQNEKEVLKNKIKVYIQTNLIQFYPLIPNYIQEEGQKIEESLYKYLDLVSKHPKQKDYLSFVKNNSVNNHKKVVLSSNNILLSEEDLMLKMISELKDEEKQTSNSSTHIDELIEKYITYRDASFIIRKRERLTLCFFKEFLKGDGKDYKEKTIEELTDSDVRTLEELFCEVTPKNKKTSSKNIFQLVKFRQKYNLRRYAKNSMTMMEFDIKNFWKYLCKHIDPNLNPNLFSSFNVLYKIQHQNFSEDKQDREIRRFKLQELQTFIDNIYKGKELKNILIDNPKNFYSFFFALMLGTRIGEFIYIRTEDIKVQIKNNKKAYFIYLNEDTKPQSLKNKNAHRNLCIPEVLIDLGFLNYVNLRIKREREWLWDFPKSGYGSISTFFQRNIKKYIPESSDNKINRQKGTNVIQYRSLRKNFAEYAFSKRDIPEHTTENSKRLIGHAEGSTTGVYLGRIEPIIGKAVIDSFKDYELDLNTLKKGIKDYYKVIQRDLDIKDENKWMIKSRAKPKKGRKI